MVSLVFDMSIDPRLNIHCDWHGNVPFYYQSEASVTKIKSHSFIQLYISRALSGSSLTFRFSLPEELITHTQPKLEKLEALWKDQIISNTEEWRHRSRSHYTFFPLINVSICLCFSNVTAGITHGEVDILRCDMLYSP